MKQELGPVTCCEGGAHSLFFEIMDHCDTSRLFENVQIEILSIDEPVAHSDGSEGSLASLCVTEFRHSYLKADSLNPMNNLGQPLISRKLSYLVRLSYRSGFSRHDDTVPRTVEEFLGRMGFVRPRPQL